MTREEAINKVRQMSLPKETMEILQALAPELKESEDERIRKGLEILVQNAVYPGLITEQESKNYLAYLEKQKEQEGMITVSKEAWDENAKDSFERGIKVGMIRQQKEQKPVDLSDMMVHKEPYIAPVPTPMVADEQKPIDYDAELEKCKHNFLYFWDKYVAVKRKTVKWSKEDEEMLQSIIKDFRDGNISSIGQEQWLKSLPERLNLQPKQEWSEEDEKDMAHIIRILDDCYVYGTHDLSKTDHENLVNKLKSLRPSWKPSEQEKGALRTAIHVLTEERSFPKAAAHLQNILNAFEGEESRKDWKPSDEQMKALSWLVEYVAPSEEYIILIKKLYEQLKKL